MSELLLRSEYWDMYCGNKTHDRLVAKINKLIKESYIIYVMNHMDINFMLAYTLIGHTKVYALNRIVNGYEYNTLDIHSKPIADKLEKIEALLQKGASRSRIPDMLIKNGTYSKASGFYRDVSMEKHRRVTLRCYISNFVDDGVMELDRDTIRFRVIPMGQYIESKTEFTRMKEEVREVFKEKVGIDITSKQ